MQPDVHHPHIALTEVIDCKHKHICVDIPNALLARQTEEQLGSGNNKNKQIHGLDQTHSQLGADTPLSFSPSG